MTIKETMYVGWMDANYNSGDLMMIHQLGWWIPFIFGSL